MESLINKWQHSFRTKIYANEVFKYNQIGQEKLESFFDEWESRLTKFFEYKKQKINNFIQKRYVERDELDRKMETGTSALRFKPKKLLTDYQTQERLVALEERIEEAQNFRKELKDLEIHEADRLNKLWNDFMQNKQRKFDTETKKLRSHLLVKLNNEENKLKIQMAKDFDVLKKQIHLHENDIKQIQNLTTKKALEVGENKGELYRLKNTLKNQNEII